MVVYPNAAATSQARMRRVRRRGGQRRQDELTINGGGRWAPSRRAGVHSPRLAWRARYDFEVDRLLLRRILRTGIRTAAANSVSIHRSARSDLAPAGWGRDDGALLRHGGPVAPLGLANGEPVGRGGSRRPRARVYHAGAAATARARLRDARAGADQWPREGTDATASAVVLRAHGPVQVAVHYSRVGLSVRYGSTWLLRDIPIPGVTRPPTTGGLGLGRGRRGATTTPTRSTICSPGRQYGGPTAADRCPSRFRPTARQLVVPAALCLPADAAARPGLARLGPMPAARRR